MDRKNICEGVELCPFLRNIHEPTVFSFSSFPAFRSPSLVKEGRGPIFEDGPNFEVAFRLFHGCNGVIPLSENKFSQKQRIESDSSQIETIPSANLLKAHITSSPALKSKDFNPLLSSVASISLSAFGMFDPFSFDGFMGKFKAANNKRAKGIDKQSSKRSNSKANLNAELHEALDIEWLSSGNCPIAKSYRAVGGVLPLVAKWLKPPSGMKVKCPPAIVAARAALARTTIAKSLRPRPLSTKVLAIGLLGMAVNVPLGVWREHTKKFSPSWFVAVHASVPFVAMLRKAIHMPRYAMAFTIASAVLGQIIGSRAERCRLRMGTTPAGELFEVSLGQLTPSDMHKPVVSLGKFESTEAKVQHNKSSIDSLAYNCAAMQKLDTTSAFASVSAPVSAF